MTTYERFFGNIFDNVHISPSRLLTFSKSTLASLNSNNPNNAFDDIIATINPLVNQFSTERSTLDTAMNNLKGQTGLVDEFTANFKLNLRILEGVITYSLGGRDQVGYLEFFPHGLTEYDSATRAEMSILLNRLDKAADKYGSQLGSTIKAELKGFKTNWDIVHDVQSTAKAEVGKNRTAKSDTRTALELALMKAIHTVAIVFTDDMNACSSFFNFNLLYHVTKHKHLHFSGSLMVAESRTIINRTLNSVVKIRVKNTSENAAIIIWLAANEKEEATIGALNVPPRKIIVTSASELGNMGNTFLRVMNLSDVNNAEFEVEVIG